MSIEHVDSDLAKIRNLQSGVARFESGLPQENGTGTVRDAAQLRTLAEIVAQLTEFVSAWTRPPKRNFADVTPAVVERTVGDVLGSIARLVRGISPSVGVNDEMDADGARLGRELVSLLAAFSASRWLGGRAVEVYAVLKFFLDDLFSPSRAVINAVREAGASTQQALPAIVRPEFDRYFDRVMRNSSRRTSS